MQTSNFQSYTVTMPPPSKAMAELLRRHAREVAEQAAKERGADR